MTDESIAICELKRFVADYAHKAEQAAFPGKPAPKNGKKVAIVGAGAAGLTCAHYLVRLGYEVDVYESEKVAGGVLAYGIPEYRLPKDVVAAEIKLFEDEGIRIHLNSPVDAAKFAELRETCDAVFVSAGTQIALKAGISGEDLEGVFPGLDFLKKVNLGEDISAGKNVVVIGGGNTAIDSARTALRLGADKVTILYRRTRDAMPADEMEIHEALEEGIELVELASPVRFIDDGTGKVSGVECEAMALGIFGPDGRRKAVPSGVPNFIVECDMAIPAISQKADVAFAEGAALTRWGTFTFDNDSMAASLDGVFAGGDVVRGPDTAIQAIADGKKAAEAIDKYLGGAGVLNKGEEIVINFKGDEDEIVELPRYPMELLSPEKRKCCFDEVVPGYHKLTAMAEAMRCLHCERR